MTRQANTLLDFMSISLGGNNIDLRGSFAQGSPYQRLICTSLARSIYTTEGFQILGRQLATISDHAYFARQMDAVEQASQLMLALPISKELKAIARYYQAVCAKRGGDCDSARRLLELVTEEAPLKYRARALLSIGVIYHANSEAESSLPFYLEAGRTARECDLFTLTASQKMIAVVRSIHGDHKQALDDLERLFPMARALGKYYPAFYYEFLNSLAVELGEVGRLNEAEAACSIALASPFATAYPEFAATRDELAAKRACATPSIVAVGVRSERSHQTKLARKAKPARSLLILWLAHAKTGFQRSNLLIVANATIALISSIQSILDRMRRSINPRSPPFRF